MNARMVSSALSPIDRLLQAHEQYTTYRSQRSGRGYRITCPACGTKSYKVAVTEADNGSVLMHAFCGHSPAEVLAAMGLTLTDLFPLRDLRTMSPEKRRELRQQSLITKHQAALSILDIEATILEIAAARVGEGIPLADADLTRIRVAALRIHDCRAVLNER